MQIVSSNKPVFAGYKLPCSKCGEKGIEGDVCYRPFTRYIVSDYESLILAEQARFTEWTRSSFNPYERRYGGQDLNGKRVCIYRHTAYGDQLMISAVPYYLKTLFPDAMLHLYCDPGVLDMWRNNFFLGGSAIPIPISFDVARSYDYHIFYEGMLENNGEPDQNNCYDDFFGMIGLTAVPDRFKRPHIVIRSEDGELARALGLDLTGKYLVYHLDPANKNRCYPPKKGMAFIEMFLDEDEFCDWKVYIVGKVREDESWKREYLECLPKRPNVIDLVGKTKSFRTLIPIVQRASLVVCPDSSVMHLTACFPDVPQITLWGLFHPDDRAKYYPNHYPLTKFGVCPIAPCHNHEFTLPLHNCTKSRGWVDGQQYCQALNAIEPGDIMDKAMEVLT